MTRRRGELEVLPPNTRSNLPAQMSLAPVSMPSRLSAGGLFERPLIRYQARSLAMTYGARGAALRAEAEATQAAADMHRARIDRATALAELEDLPNRLADERYLRRLGRLQEIRNLEHEIAIAEIDHQVQVTRKSAELTEAVTDLTLARANCTAGRQRLAEATQAYTAQLENGDKHFALLWERKINEETLFVEEQRAILQEHRDRVAVGDRTRTQFDATPINPGDPSNVQDTPFRFKRTR